MQTQRKLSAWSVFAALAALALLILRTPAAAANNEKVVYTFQGGAKGSYPSPNLLSDSAGNLYGTTTDGGDHGMGTVFELSPKSGGGWKNQTVYTFHGVDGSSPSSVLIADSAGNLYGETGGGGSNGKGTVYELSRSGNLWNETVLYNFVDQTTGVGPSGGLAFDANGNLYGTTLSGGVPFDLGTVFQLTPDGSGNWGERVILSFGRNGDGGDPVAGLVIDSQGNLFGTTFTGYSAGTIFELTPQPDGGWKTTVLHRFTGGNDGAFPSGNLILDASGDLYGTAQSGGAMANQNGCDFGCGTVFKLARGAKRFKFSVLYSFTGGQDGKQPDGALSFDTLGNLYGTTEDGGGSGCEFGYGCGTMFVLSAAAKGAWAETVLHRFQSQSDGLQPRGAVVTDANGNWYGTTSSGGTKNLGTVFRITP